MVPLNFFGAHDGVGSKGTETGWKLVVFRVDPVRRSTRRKMKRIIRRAILILAILVLIGAFMYTRFADQFREMTYKPVDVAMVEDGVYQGNALTSLVKVNVEVTVADHKITSIRILRHDTGLGGKAEAIVDRMVTENTADVDGVAGATISSKMIRNAVSNALAKGLP